MQRSTHETKQRIAESYWRAVTPKLSYNLPGQEATGNGIGHTQEGSWHLHVENS
jgi:hypothetical protein